MFPFIHAPSSSSSSSIIPYFNKNVLVMLHNEAKSRFEAMRSSLSRHCISTTLEPPLSSVNRLRSYPDISHLRPISLLELQIETVHTGRVLYGTLCVQPFEIHGVWTVLETDEPGYAVRVSVYDSDPEWRAKYPAGKRLAIKEPYFRFSRGTLSVRVDNVQSIVEAPPVEEDTILPEEVKDIMKLKAEGNRFFGMKDWNQAIVAYSSCIVEAMELADNVSGSLPDETVVKLKTETLVPAFSNRAEAWLKLGAYENALADSNCALEVDPKHIKSMFRKGRALEGLHEYERALTWLGLAMVNGAPVEDVEPVIQIAKVCQEQSKTGRFLGVKQFLLGQGPPPKCSDFVGPVKIQEVSYPGRQSGIGLFATRNVIAGELLIVSNALGCVSANDRVSSIHLFDQVMPKLSSKSGRAAAQLTVLLEGQCPNGNMDVFRANGGVVPEDLKEVGPAAGEEFIAAVCERSSRMPFEMRCRERIGVWVLPAVMRHSCLSNTSIVHVGAAAFVHAAREVKAGEELTAGYCDNLLPYETRRQSLEMSLGFTCRCQRCELEKSKKKHLENLLELSPASVVKVLEKKLKAMRKDLDEEKECWIRASYVFPQIILAKDLEVLLSSSQELKSALELATAIHTTVPGHHMSRLLTFHWMISCHKEFRQKLELNKELVLSLHRSYFGTEEVKVEEALKIWENYFSFLRNLVHKSLGKH